MKQNKEDINICNNLLRFINDSPTAFHAVNSVKEELIKSGFNELHEEESWNLKKEGKYFLTKNGSAIIAFVVGTGDIFNEGFKIIGAHTDSPTLRIKPKPEIVSENSYLKLNVEVYGSPILNTFLDRPLSIAGRVVLKGDNILKPKSTLVNFNKPLLTIPNLAIHMNRNVNSGVELNRQKDMLPLMGMINLMGMSKDEEKESMLNKAIGEELNVNVEDILNYDLFLYEYEKGCIFGLNDEFISSSRLDDLSMVYAGLESIKDSHSSKATNVLCCFDNEEVGSMTKAGAQSPLLLSVLRRVVFSFSSSEEDYYRAIASSFMISADMAHAAHPNCGEKADPVLRPVLNGGPVIKVSASCSYTSDGVSSSIYENICKSAGVPYQIFTNRSDEKGGSTIGPITATHLTINSVDIGTPILAMHSIRETAGTLDENYVIKSFKEFYRI